MRLDDETLKEILLTGKFVSAGDYRKAEASDDAKTGSPIDYLLRTDLLTEERLGEAIAAKVGLAYADLGSNRPPREQVLKIPEAIAKKYRIVLYREAKRDLVVATDDPTQKDLPAALERLFPRMRITLAFALPHDLEQTFTYYREPLKTRFSSIIKKEAHVAPALLEELFQDALMFRTSDIHFEPQNGKVLIRFRVDGVLQEVGTLPPEQYENILNRIKVQSRLRIDEHYAAQDGSLRYQKDGVVYDLRTSIVPTIEGEKIVLRVLASYLKGFSLEDLGLSLPDRKTFLEASKKPFGMIIVAGPTGSGKTTTLYALLRQMNQPDVNITTIEDPVEYKVAGLNQIQVNAATGLTFANGLRSIVRQDPDIVLVGEIRDRETAEISVNAALTGQLLFSTFHANDAATVIPRLLDMGIEPFLLSSTLILIVSQRLVRRICDTCRVKETASPRNLAKLFKRAPEFFGAAPATLYRGKGCETCGGTGYQGRTGIFELISVSPALQERILTRPSSRAIWELARSEGARSMFEDGVEKVKSGATTLEELLRVAEPPDDGTRHGDRT